jgi:hypothetical protein
MRLLENLPAPLCQRGGNSWTDTLEQLEQSPRPQGAENKVNIGHGESFE